jgi:uncharacterized protein YodC (DUF2158 family)
MSEPVLGKLLQSGQGASAIPIRKVGTVQMFVEVLIPRDDAVGNFLFTRGASHEENNGIFLVLDGDENGLYVSNPKCEKHDYVAEWDLRAPYTLQDDFSDVLEEAASMPAPSVRVAVEGQLRVAVHGEAEAYQHAKTCLKRGDVVTLKSGGPKMTVERITGEDFRCTWFNHSEAEKASTATFHRDLLKEAASV